MLYFLKYYYLIIFMLKNNKAFTFAELMVSVTIIAILSTISVIGLISYLESVRDVNRV
ncbi:MAG: prepilin-type N-terminal cleavage/methylation domain-containing protein [Patescibacteria group bacterium]|nr:prepilin-type N-terminal cleavage/methylation domain-containing protein [Patescibacteria group bacterium]